jgi:hypothetical protein
MNFLRDWMARLTRSASDNAALVLLLFSRMMMRIRGRVRPLSLPFLQKAYLFSGKSVDTAALSALR